MDGKQIGSLEPALDELTESFRKCFHEPTFKHFRTYLLGLMEDLRRKNVEAIALAADTPVRTLQEFLSQFCWDHDRVHEFYQHLVADRHSCPDAIGVIDSSGHPKQGKKTPGVQRQYCGQTGKIDNCVVAVHWAYVAGDVQCLMDSDLFLPAAST